VSVPEDPRHRRDFLRAVALTGPAAVLAGGPVAGDDKIGQAREAIPADPPRSEVDARMDLILARFGKLLDADARASVRAEVESIVRRMEMLRTFPLDNGDGPFPVFIPYRAPLG
jgi:hypothetical protein